MGEPHVGLGRLRRIVARVNAMEPDLVLILGDLVAGHRFVTAQVPVAETAQVLAGLKGRLGVFAVLGNHDDDVLQGFTAGSEGDHLHFTEAGADQCFRDDAHDYLRKLRHRLVLSWRSKRIVLMHGHINADDKAVSWRASPEEQSAHFVESDADLCIMSHTHYAYVRQHAGAICANTGSMSLPFIGVQDEHGLYLHSGKVEIGPDDDVRSSFLMITAPDGELQVEIVRFDYDRQAELQDHLQTSSPLPDMLTKELLAMCSGIWKV